MTSTDLSALQPRDMLQNRSSGCVHSSTQKLPDDLVTWLNTYRNKVTPRLWVILKTLQREKWMRQVHKAGVLKGGFCLYVNICWLFSKTKSYRSICGRWILEHFDTEGKKRCSERGGGGNGLALLRQMKQTPGWRKTPLSSLFPTNNGHKPTFFQRKTGHINTLSACWFVIQGRVEHFSLRRVFSVKRRGVMILQWLVFSVPFTSLVFNLNSDLE